MLKKPHLQISKSFLYTNANPNQNQHQYKATQLWHTSLNLFLSSVPLKPHRSKSKFWKVYEDTFTGLEGIQWFQDELKDKLDKEISREQVKRLLGKFMRVGVFERVEGNNSEGGFRGSGLYRLVDPPPPKQRNEIRTELTEEDKENICKDLLLENLLPATQTSQKISTTILTNITAQNSPLPPWLPPALHYLSTYPNTTIEITYPNFPLDVYSLIYEYYKGYTEKNAVLIEDHGELVGSLKLKKYDEKFVFSKCDVEDVEVVFGHKKSGCGGYENKSLMLSPGDLINHPKYEGLAGVGLMGGTVNPVAQPNQSAVIDDDIKKISLMFLALKPEKRAHLEALLKYLNEIMMNEVLSFNREMLLTHFTPLIIKEPSSSPHHLTLYLISNAFQLFNNKHIESFKKEFNEKVNSNNQLLTQPNLNFCSKITLNEYEDQRLLGETAKSLRELLEVILKMEDGKERRKRLKDFRKEYPHIWGERFGRGE